MTEVKKVQATFDGFLFDMDGTLIDSGDAVLHLWDLISAETGIPRSVYDIHSLGRRTIEVLSVCNPEYATWEFVHKIEGQIPKLYADKVQAIPGAKELVRDIHAADDVPWAVVTSGSRPLVQGWLEILGISEPHTLVSAEQVEVGKPSPVCYQVARERLAIHKPEHHTVVFEDTPPGMRAGIAAGCSVVGLLTSATLEQVQAAKPTWIVKDMSSVRVVGHDQKQLTLEFTDLYPLE